MVEKARLDKDKVSKKAPSPGEDRTQSRRFRGYSTLSFNVRSIFRSIYDMIRASLCFGLMGQAGTVVQAIFA